MDDTQKAFLDRIDYLLRIGDDASGTGAPIDIGREVFAGTLGVAFSLYGAGSPQVATINETNSRVMNYPSSEALKSGYVIKEMRGVLKAIKSDIESGLFQSIRDQARGDIIADFVILAKDALDGEVKDVAAVLACAALEDALKRFAESSGIDVDGKDLSAVINALKATGLLQATQAKVVQSFVGVRNKAFHAEWQKIDASEVHAVLAFVQSFLATRFT